MKKYRITVTEDDIRAGVPVEPAYCPVALATQRETGIYCGVDNKGVDFFPPYHEFVRILLPKKIDGWITRFDAFGRMPWFVRRLFFVGPISFDLEVPE